jgi:hypothetical protein
LACPRDSPTWLPPTFIPSTVITVDRIHIHTTPSCRHGAIHHCGPPVPIPPILQRLIEHAHGPARGTTLARSGSISCPTTGLEHNASRNLSLPAVTTSLSNILRRRHVPPRMVPSSPRPPLLHPLPPPPPPQWVVSQQTMPGLWSSLLCRKPPPLPLDPTPPPPGPSACLPSSTPSMRKNRRSTVAARLPTWTVPPFNPVLSFPPSATGTTALPTLPLRPRC